MIQKKETIKKPNLKQSIKTKVIRTVMCHKCGEKGVLKHRIMAAHKSQKTGKLHNFQYYQVDHYFGNRHEKYLHSCYIRKIEEEDELKQ